MIDSFTRGAAALDPLGFVIDELAARGALIERGDHGALAVLPEPLAARLAVPEAIALDSAASDRAVGCGLGSPLLDRLVGEVRTTVPIASVRWQAEPPRLAVAERLAERLVVRNGVADVLGVAHASATYLAGVFAWTAEADDRYQGMVLAVAHAGTTGEPEASCLAAIEQLILGDGSSAGLAGQVAGQAAGHVPGHVARQVAGQVPEHVIEERDARGASGGASAVARRAAFAIGPRLDEVGTAVARRRDRERARIDEYFGSLIGEARRPRRQVARDAIGARVAALHAEHTAKLRDLAARYTLRVRIEPIALVAIAARVSEIRLRLRRRKGERTLELHVPPAARAPDALACVACPATTRAPLLCDDALHVLCEACAPEVGGRPRCPACRPTRDPKKPL